MAHDITTLGGQTPETLMGGETADISEMCEYDWFLNPPCPGIHRGLGRVHGTGKVCRTDDMLPHPKAQ
jgi:hypothetical protein